MRRLILLSCAIILLLSGCYTKQVRHLASDAALVKPGQSTRREVLQLLGQPDGHRMISPGVEEFVYYENRRSSLGRMPLVGSWVGPEGYEMMIITLDHDTVKECEFRVFSEDDQSWKDDFTWDEVK